MRHRFQATMLSLTHALIFWAVLGIWTPVLTAPGTQAHYETIHRDVCVIGGGASGTYSAIRLRQMGKSVALLEKDHVLGGHVDTYFDPTSGKPIDYGVKVYNNFSVVRDFFYSLDVPLKKFTSYISNQQTLYADLANAITVPTAENNAPNVTDGLLRYQAQLQKYPFLGNGFHLPSSIPEDLLMPWGDFIEKYNLSAIVRPVFSLVGGPGNILSQPTLYVAKNFGEIQVQSALKGLALTEANDDNQALYDKALARLGNGTNAFIRSNVTHVRRTNNGTEVTVSTTQGLKVIQASKLLIAIPPKLSVLKPFLDLSPEEYDLFSQFNNSYIWASVVANSGIPDDAGLANVDPEAALGIPPLPAIFLAEPSGVSGNHIVLYGSPFSIPEEKVKANILTSLNRWKIAMGHGSNNGTKPEIMAFKCHSPYLLTVSNKAIMDGFYDKLNALQGQRNTFWTGAAWQIQDSTALWNFTELQILPKITASLG